MSRVCKYALGTLIMEAMYKWPHLNSVTYEAEMCETHSQFVVQT